MIISPHLLERSSKDPEIEAKLSLRKKWKWFVGDKLTTNIQDPVHEGAKLRTRLLKHNIFLPIGNTIASRECLVSPKATVTKDKHGLYDADLSLVDKMNYSAVERLCEPSLSSLLELHVPGYRHVV